MMILLRYVRGGSDAVCEDVKMCSVLQRLSVKPVCTCDVDKRLNEFLAVATLVARNSDEAVARSDRVMFGLSPASGVTRSVLCWCVWGRKYVHL